LIAHRRCQRTHTDDITDRKALDPMIVRTVLAATAATMLMVFLGSCVDTSQEGARTTAASFLEAACGGHDLRGWELIEEPSKAYPSLDAYLEAAANGCNGFDWSIVEVNCGDGVCTVWLDATDPLAVPGFLAGRLVDTVLDHQPAGANAAMNVARVASGSFAVAVLAGAESVEAP
jgi:hypothetical protein